MTREEAKELLEKLTTEEKVILFEMLVNLKENPSPAECHEQED